MNLASNYNLWAVAGLVYTLAGAALFCHATFLTPRPSAASVDDAKSMHRLTEQWLERRIATVLLVAGFFFQMTGAVGTSTLNKPAVFLLLALALAAGYYAFSKDLIIDSLVAPDGIAREPARSSLPPPKAPIAPSTEASPVIVVDLRQNETAA